MNKKTFKCAVFDTLATFAQFAHAQSSLTLYGQLDAGVTYVSNAGGSQQYKFDDGVSWGNRWGMIGTEDLGGGTKAIFRLESGFGLGDGTSHQGGALFGRQAYVGLSSTWGTLTFGHQYDFIADFVATYGVSGWASGYGIHQGDFDHFSLRRLDNSVKYVSGVFGGFQFGGMYAFSNTPGSFHDNSAWSVSAQYTRGPFQAGAAYVRVNSPYVDPYAAIGAKTFLGQTVATTDETTGAVTDLYANSPLQVESQGIFGVGMQYEIGKLTLMANYTNTRFRGGGHSSAMSVYEGGGLYQVSPELRIALGYQHTTFEGARWNQVSPGIDYALSKRTDVYISGDFLKASSGINPVIGYSFAPSTSSTQSDVRIGLHHAF